MFGVHNGERNQFFGRLFEDLEEDAEGAKDTKIPRHLQRQEEDAYAVGVVRELIPASEGEE